MKSRLSDVMDCANQTSNWADIQAACARFLQDHPEVTTFRELHRQAVVFFLERTGFPLEPTEPLSPKSMAGFVIGLASCIIETEPESPPRRRLRQDEDEDNHNDDNNDDDNHFP
jgi:hypothetical protein